MFKSHHCLVILICVVFSLKANITNAQISYLTPKNGWTAKEWRKANTARFSVYMNKEMRNSIRYMNLARMFPKRFAELHLLPDSANWNGYHRSLNKTLHKADAVKALRPAFGLHVSAAIHAIGSGVTGHTGHRGFNWRFLVGLPFNASKRIGENCDYGSRKALDITMSLLVDEGVPNLGHRKNILSEDFYRVGASRFFHIGYRWNAVFEYSGASMKDLMLYEKADWVNYGLNVGVQNFNNYPHFHLGIAKYMNNDDVHTMLLAASYDKGLNSSSSDALSLSFGAGTATGFWDSWMLGGAFHSYLDSKEMNLYFEPQLSFYFLINLFHDGYLLEVNNPSPAALYRFTYSYEIPVAADVPSLAPHHISFSRFICLKQKSNDAKYAKQQARDKAQKLKERQRKKERKQKSKARR